MVAVGGLRRRRGVQRRCRHEAVDDEADVLKHALRLVVTQGARLGEVTLCSSTGLASPGSTWWTSACSIQRMVTEPARALLAELCVSATADACAVRGPVAVGGWAASPEVLREMARIGAVGKLCQRCCGAPGPGVSTEAAGQLLRKNILFRFFFPFPCRHDKIIVFDLVVTVDRTPVLAGTP